jgi:2-aminoadipate transaminase
MTAGSFDFAPVLAAGLPPPAAKWAGSPKYNFTGGNNDADQIPLDRLIAAANAVLAREGRTLATYGLASGPLGYRPLREFLAAKLARTAGISCTAD